MVAAIIAAIVLLTGVIALVSARMPAPPALAVVTDTARPAPLALPPSAHAGEFESRAGDWRSEELRRALSVRIGPSAAVARAPLSSDLAMNAPPSRTAGLGRPGFSQSGPAVADEQSRAKGHAKLAALHLPQQIPFAIAAIRTDAAAPSIALPAAEPMRATAMPRLGLTPSVIEALGETQSPSRPAAAAREIRPKVALAALPAPDAVSDVHPAAGAPAIIAREVSDTENASPEISATEPSHSLAVAALPSARVPLLPARPATSASRRPRLLAAVRIGKAKKKRAAKPARKRAQKTTRLPARRKSAAVRKKKLAVRRAAAAAATSQQQQNPFASGFGFGWWQQPAGPATRVRQGQRRRQGLEF